MIPANSWWRQPTFWNQALTVFVSLYILGLFLPGLPKLENIALYGAVLITLFDGRWRSGLQWLTHPLILLLLALLGWLLLTATLSDQPLLSLTEYRRSFKDYFLIFLPLMFVLSNEASRRLLARLIAFWGVIIVCTNGAQYVHEWFTDPSRLLDVKAHRGWGHPLVFLLPFALMEMRLSAGRVSWAWLLLALVEAAMIIATGARGAWLAMLAVVLVWAVAGFNRKQLLRLAAGGFVILLIAYFVLPTFLLRAKVEQGFDSSSRTTGTWGPAIEMMDERPMLGFGFGKDAFSREFNQRAPERESWSIKQSIGPHSLYLEAGFAGGYPALSGIILLFGATLAYGYLGFGRSRLQEQRLFVLAASSAFVGFYLTRGAMETIRWGPMIILLGIIVSASRPPSSQ
ncbi:MAG TPA: O-antigen ligase family protein [Candidatus Propionivibrio aalborgensis]|nr:O-antigen ligase family protein [Candidatus Propionivibrio aalborgensis]